MNPAYQLQFSLQEQFLLTRHLFISFTKMTGMVWARSMHGSQPARCKEGWPRRIGRMRCNMTWRHRTYLLSIKQTGDCVVKVLIAAREELSVESVSKRVSVYRNEDARLLLGTTRHWSGPVCTSCLCTSSRSWPATSGSGRRRSATISVLLRVQLERRKTAVVGVVIGNRQVDVTQPQLRPRHSATC